MSNKIEYDPPTVGPRKKWTFEAIGTTTEFDTVEEALMVYEHMTRRDYVRIYKDFDTGKWKVVRAMGTARRVE